MTDENQILRPVDVRRGVQHWAKQNEPTVIDNGKRGALIKHLKDALAQADSEGNDLTDRNRYLVCGWLCLDDDSDLIEVHSDQMTPQEWNGISRWIGARKVGDCWLPRPSFEAEARWILNCAIFDLSRIGMTKTEVGGYKPKPLVMRDFVAFWTEHLPLTAPEGLVGEAIKVGGVVTSDDPPDVSDKSTGEFMIENYWESPVHAEGGRDDKSITFGDDLMMW